MDLLCSPISPLEHALLRSYSRLKRINNLEIPVDELKSLQSFLITHVLESQHFSEYPPAISYQSSFWKYIISVLEAGGEEVDERVYRRYIDTLGSTMTLASNVPPAPSYVSYVYKSPGSPDSSLRCITLHESQKVIESGTTGLRTWSASLALAHWLLHHPEEVRGRSALELGSGTGFLGIIVALLQLEHKGPAVGAGRLYLTDVDGSVLQQCHRNIQLTPNGVSKHPNMHTRLLDWNDALEANPQGVFTNKGVHVIIGADLVFDPSIIPALAATIDLMLRHNTTDERPCMALMALTVRRQETFDSFVFVVDGLGLSIAIYDLLPASKTVFAVSPSVLEDEFPMKLLRIQV